MKKPEPETRIYQDFYLCAKYIAHKYGHDFSSNVLRVAGLCFHHYATDPDWNTTVAGFNMPQSLSINRDCVNGPKSILEVVDQFVSEFGKDMFYENDC